MSVNLSRSRNGSLDEGATDGKYRKRRPDTQIYAGDGDDEVMENRESLNPFMNYGFINAQTSHMHNPGR